MKMTPPLIKKNQFGPQMNADKFSFLLSAFIRVHLRLIH